MTNLKKLILEEYEKNNRPISIEDFNERYRDEINKNEFSLGSSSLLDDVYGLSFEQVIELIKYYGDGFLFAPDIEENVKSFFSTQRELKDIEEKSKKN